MKPVLDAAQTKRLEADAEEKGRPSSVLMERAGCALANEVLALGPTEVLVVCGRGNNGGDGLVAARRLAFLGRRVRVQVVGGPGGLKGEPARNLELLQGLPCAVGDLAPETRLEPMAVVIDAVFGTGLNRAPEGDYAEAIRMIERLRTAGARVVAADLASGVESDSGQVFEPAVTADVTVCFGILKIGACIEPGSSQSGRVRAVDIGLADAKDARVFWLEEEDVLGWIPKRAPNSHKGTFGHLLVIAGSRGKSGAAAMAALSALRSGVGLVTVATPADALDAVLGHAPELMGIALDVEDGLGPEHWEALAETAKSMQAIAVGPGISKGPRTADFFAALLREFLGPIVIDADGLNVIADRLELLGAAKGRVVLTPHPGEMARLAKKTSKEIQANRLEIAREFAQTHGVTLVLKGSRTLVALGDGTVRINPTGNPGMASGGTGDVLTGMIGSLLAQKLAPAEAASAGVFVHGLSGDRMRDQRGEAGLIATDVIEGLGPIWARWSR